MLKTIIVNGKYLKQIIEANKKTCIFALIFILTHEMEIIKRIRTLLARERRQGSTFIFCRKKTYLITDF